MTEMSSSSPQEQIFGAFAATAPAGWRTGRVEYRVAGRTSEFSLTATDAEGRVSTPGVSGFELGDAVEELRERMAQPGKGAWFTATIDLEASGRISIDVDYDAEPAWDVPVAPETYAEEQELFPREPEFQPPWYRERLRQATPD